MNKCCKEGVALWGFCWTFLLKLSTEKLNPRVLQPIRKSSGSFWRPRIENLKRSCCIQTEGQALELLKRVVEKSLQQEKKSYLLLPGNFGMASFILVPIRLYRISVLCNIGTHFSVWLQAGPCCKTFRLSAAVLPSKKWTEHIWCLRSLLSSPS